MRVGIWPLRKLELRLEKFMNDKNVARNRCNAILIACLGEALVSNWWDRPNKAFDMKTPDEVWSSEDWYLVYNYLRGLDVYQ